jgi:hypothetical protein
MDKQQLTEKGAELLRTFETTNLIAAMKDLSIKQIFSHPVVLIVIASIFVYGVLQRSKPVLLGLFSLVCVAAIVRYAMPSPNDNLSASSTLPFIGGGLLIGAVLIYFSLIKSD